LNGGGGKKKKARLHLPKRVRKRWSTVGKKSLGKARNGDVEKGEDLLVGGEKHSHLTLSRKNPPLFSILAGKLKKGKRGLRRKPEGSEKGRGGTGWQRRCTSN